MTHEQIEAFLENAGYELGGLSIEEIEVLAGVEGFLFDDKKERFYYAH